MAVAAILNFFYIFEILTVRTLKRLKLRHRAKFFDDRSLLRYNDYRFFQYVGCPPSWISYARVGTRQRRAFVVFITLQNLV